METLSLPPLPHSQTSAKPAMVRQEECVCHTTLLLRFVLRGLCHEPVCASDQGSGGTRAWYRLPDVQATLPGCPSKVYCFFFSSLSCSEHTRCVKRSERCFTLPAAMVAGECEREQRQFSILGREASHVARGFASAAERGWRARRRPSSFLRLYHQPST